MKKIYGWLGVCTVLFSLQTQAKPLDTTLPKTTDKSTSTGTSRLFHVGTYLGMTSYNDFKFNSTSGNNYNRFDGHSTLLVLGANDVYLKDDLSAGLYAYSLDTQLTSRSFLSPSALSLTRQNVQTGTVFGHVLKQFKPEWFLDLMGGYGRNRLIYRTEPQGSFAGEDWYARTHSTNWFFNASGFYSRSWGKLLTTASLGVLFSDVNQDPFTFEFAPPAYARVQSLENKSTFLLENIELAYSVTPTIQPFVEAGLLQVVRFNNSRALVNSAFVIGSLPAFNLDQNGYRGGVGISWTHHQYVVRLEQYYDQRGHVYHSNQTMATLKINMS